MPFSARFRYWENGPTLESGRAMSTGFDGGGDDRR
jgi:hypothetical protein